MSKHSICIHIIPPKFTVFRGKKGEVLINLQMTYKEIKTLETIIEILIDEGYASTKVFNEVNNLIEKYAANLVSNK